MRVLSYFAASLATVTALSVTARQEKIPEPAPASAYLKAGPDTQGKVQPLIAREPPGGLNRTVIPAEIPDAPPAKEQSLRAAACSGPASSSPTDFWMNRMDHTGNARGYAPFLSNYYSYPTWRNVLDYGAKNDGSGDQTAAIQSALNSDGRGGNRYGTGPTAQPAHVFLPGGTYTLNSQIDLRRGTIIMGDPQNPPILRAGPGFQGEILIRGHDVRGAPETAFLISLRNVIIDTTAIDRNRRIVALQWGVAQGCSLGNIKIRMPTESAAHVGIWLENGSTIILADLEITGGAIGIQNSNQQANFKNIYFKYCRTAYAGTGGWSALLQKVTFDTCGAGVDLVNEVDPGRLAGSLVLLDSRSINSGTTLRFRESSPSAGRRNNQILIQNFRHDNGNPIAVTYGGDVKLGAVNYVDTWNWGNAVPGQFQEGVSSITPRPAVLLDANGDFFTKDAPTYAGYALDQFINVKDVAGFPVRGDGGTDDSANLNAILAQAAAACQIVYFPFGSYVVKSTLFIPSNSRIVGEAWPVISGAGDRFKNPNSPQPVVKVGNPGDIGLVHISDMRISPAEPLPGAIMLEVNIAGTNKGDVGIWNTQITFGGTADTTIKDICTNQDTTNCRAAYLGVHLTPSSSAYVQNLWVWTADHNLEGGSGITIISTGRGILVQSTKATWLVGTGAEHNWLYNYNFDQAQNLFAGLMQIETPYMQGDGAVLLAPAPWVANLAIGDPDFNWCGGGDGRCRSAVGNNINGGSNLFLYNSAAWAFFNGPWDGQYSGEHWCQGNCQTNMNRVSGAPSKLFWYGIATKSADTLVFDGRSNPKELNNPGGWGGNLQKYTEFA